MEQSVVVDHIVEPLTVVTEQTLAQNNARTTDSVHVSNQYIWNDELKFVVPVKTRDIDAGKYCGIHMSIEDEDPQNNRLVTARIQATIGSAGWLRDCVPFMAISEVDKDNLPRRSGAADNEKTFGVGTVKYVPLDIRTYFQHGGAIIIDSQVRAVIDTRPATPADNKLLIQPGLLMQSNATNVTFAGIVAIDCRIHKHRVPVRRSEFI